jgi:heptosyltransferase I
MTARDKVTLKHIGLVRLSAIGDVVLCVPLVRTLQAQFPDATITWITDKSAYQLLKGLSGVEFVVIEKPKNMKDYWQFRQRMRPYHFDVLLAMQACFRANFLYPLIRATRKIGFDNNRARDLHSLFINEKIEPGQDHLLKGFLRFAEKLGCVSPMIAWDLHLSQEDRRVANDLLPKGQFIAINPKASKTERNWFVERYVQVIKEIERQYQLSVVLTGGPDDADMALKIAGATNAINLVGKTTLKQLACVLSKANVLIAPDTGPAHIATAVGTPVIGLYAVAPSALSGPYLSRELVIDKYSEAVKTLLNKDPETVSWGTRVHTQNAMALISVEDVLSTLKRVLLPAQPA